MESPIDALAALDQQHAVRERSLEEVVELGKFMTNVLQTRGELIIARHGLYNGTPGLIGSATSGQRIIHSTLPVPLGNGDFVALRHPIRQPDPDSPRFDGVELIKTQAEGPGYCVIEPEIDERYAHDPFMTEHLRSQGIKYTRDEVIASFIKLSFRAGKPTAPSLSIKSNTDYTEDELRATKTLVKHIEDSLEPISEEWQRVTKKLPYTPSFAGGREIREGATLLQDLDPFEVDLATIR